MMPSLIENPDQRSYRVNLPQVTEDHGSFDDFSTTPPQFLMRESIHAFCTVSAPLTKSGKDVPKGRRSDHKKQTQIQNAKEKQTADPTDTEEKSKVDVDSTSINRKELLVKADLDSLESEMKTYSKTYDAGIKKQSDIVVEEMQPLESIIPDCFFKVYIDKAYVNYYNADIAKDLATQDASARTDEVADIEMSLINTIKGLSTCAGQPWYLVNEVFVPINYDGAFHWVLAVIALND
ncbi:hypothetical protein CQW23_01247 [Capsicum baccatum]|uniref:Ubiquitin-like protease family profile domain-containing protein n=1 Tax=Capsicum baccatum TaxID=33114 RepID=A0A2G2XN16_CAPBA|nr:hypothetical protein CQW23_01247 [Capsicum baccatum]